MVKHQLWAKGEPGLPEAVTDRNGDVVLGMCRVCGQAEAELEDACPGYKWPEGSVALLWSAFGLGKWVTVDSSTGTWEVELADVPMPADWDWRVPVMRQAARAAVIVTVGGIGEPLQPGIDLEQFRGTGISVARDRRAPRRPYLHRERPQTFRQRAAGPDRRAARK